MLKWRQLLWVALFALLPCFASGCKLMHELKPHRMWRWNRQPPPSTGRFYSQTMPDSSQWPLDGEQERASELAGKKRQIA